MNYNNKNKPKALILAFKNDYLNPTDDVFYHVLDEIFDVFYYGPGYIPLKKLITDPVEIYKKFGPFDACFIHQYVIYNLYHAKGALEHPLYNQHFHFNTKVFCKARSDFAKGYNKIPCNKFLLSLRTDCYMFTPGEEEEYVDFEGHIIAPPPEFITPCENLNDFEKENFFDRATNRYINFCNNNYNKIIPIPHIIAEDEFIDISGKKEKHLISVPGCPYYERIKVFDKLKVKGYDPIREHFLSTALRYIIHCSKIQFGAHPVGIKFFKWAFKNIISNSLFSFTDGSRVRAPIRKFFEIPAFGSVLLADPFWNHKDLGFIDGENFVACNSDTIIDVLNYYQKNPELSLNLKSKLQLMIRNKHSHVAWVNYFKEIYELINNSNYKGATWKDGNLVVDKS